MGKLIHVRFNTNFAAQKSLYQWRVIEDSQEHLVNSVRIECPCYSTFAFIEGHGMKYHLTAVAENLEIVESAGQKVAYIK